MIFRLAKWLTRRDNRSLFQEMLSASADRQTLPPVVLPPHSLSLSLCFFEPK